MEFIPLCLVGSAAFLDVNFGLLALISTKLPHLSLLFIRQCSRYGSGTEKNSVIKQVSFWKNATDNYNSDSYYAPLNEEQINIRFIVVSGKFVKQVHFLSSRVATE